MKKAKRKWVCNGLIILMALCMLNTSALAAVADGNTILPRYVGITEINATPRQSHPVPVAPHRRLLESGRRVEDQPEAAEKRRH